MFLNDLGYYFDISIVIKYFTYILFLIKWLVAYKCDYRSHIKQVIISCEFVNILTVWKIY